MFKYFKYYSSDFIHDASDVNTRYDIFSKFRLARKSFPVICRAPPRIYSFSQEWNLMNGWRHRILQYFNETMESIGLSRNKVFDVGLFLFFQLIV